MGKVMSGGRGRDGASQRRRCEQCQHSAGGGQHKLRTVDGETAGMGLLQRKRADGPDMGLKYCKRGSRFGELQRCG